jgi:hypothetical protein
MKRMKVMFTKTGLIITATLVQALAISFKTEFGIGPELIAVLVTFNAAVVYGISATYKLLS